MHQQPRTPPPRIFPADQRLALRLRKLDPGARSKAEALSEAATMLAKNRAKYEAELALHIQKLLLLSTAVSQDRCRAANIRALKRTAHEIKGQAQIYGYGLIGELATSICTCFSHLEIESRRFVSAIQGHAEAIDALYRRGVTGDGSETERAILGVLQGSVMADRRSSDRVAAH